MIHSTDIVPVSEVQAQLPRLIKEIRGTDRPIVVTQRGRASAVLIDVAEYDKLTALADLAMAELERRANEGGPSIPWREVEEEFKQYLIDR